MSDHLPTELAAFLHAAFEAMDDAATWPCEDYCSETYVGMAKAILPFVRKAQAEAFEAGKTAASRGIRNNPYIDEKKP